MKAKLRATVTITEEYEADSHDYLMAEKVSDMIAMDKQNFIKGPRHFLNCMMEGDVKTKITIVRVK